MPRPGTRGHPVARKLQVATWLGSGVLVALGCVHFTVAADRPDWLQHLGLPALGLVMVALGAGGALGSALALRLGALACAGEGVLTIAAALGALAPGDSLLRHLPVLGGAARLVSIVVLVKTAGVVSAASAPPPRTWGWPARWTIILFATVLFAGGVLAWNARRIENQVTVALACLARGEATCARQAIAPVANAVDGEPILQVAAAGVAVAGHRLDEAQGLLGAASSHGFGADRRLQAEWNLTMGDLLAARGQYHVALARYAEAGTRPGAGDHAQARSARLQARARTELGPLLLQARDGLAAVAAGAPLGRPQLAQDIMERLLGDDAGIASRVRAATAGLSPDLATRIAVARTLQARLADYPSQAPRPPAPLGAAQAKDPLAVADRDFAQKAYDRALEQYRDGQVDLERQLARANAESAEAAATVKAALAAVEQVLDELQVVRAPLPQSSELTAAPLGPQSEAPPPRMVPSGAAL